MPMRRVWGTCALVMMGSGLGGAIGASQTTVSWPEARLAIARTGDVAVQDEVRDALQGARDMKLRFDRSLPIAARAESGSADARRSAAERIARRASDQLDVAEIALRYDARRAQVLVDKSLRDLARAARIAGIDPSSLTEEAR